MSRYSIVITEQADADINSIGLYMIEELHHLTAARRFLDLVDARILELERFPRMHSPIRNKRLREYRKIHVMNYIVFYTIDEPHKTVVIQRVLYCRRDWMNLLYLEQ